jgi:membrane protein
MEKQDLQPLLKTAIELKRRALYLVHRFRKDRCTDNAAALTYMSLFALVPLLTVMYTMATAVPAFQGLEAQMQTFLFENLVPETSSEIETYLKDFSQQAKNLTGAGIIFLVVTAVLMLRNIERAFNLIWRARENRSAVSSFLLYWAVLSLSPVTIGLALGISTYLGSAANALEQYDIFGLKAYLLLLIPLTLNVLGFSLLYAAVPNCQVPLKHALVGGIFAALAFNLARSLFTKIVVNSSYTFIYGAFAAVPLFLLWIYLSWNIVLLGGILVHSLSAYQSEDQASRPNLLKALDVLHFFWQRQQSGGTVIERDLLRPNRDGSRTVDSETWRHLLDVLKEKNVIAVNDRGHYLLARDLHGISLWQLKQWVNDEQPFDDPDRAGDLEWQRRAGQLIHDQRLQQRQLLDIDLAALFQT